MAECSGGTKHFDILVISWEFEHPSKQLTFHCFFTEILMRNYDSMKKDNSFDYSPHIKTIHWLIIQVPSFFGGYLDFPFSWGSKYNGNIGTRIHDIYFLVCFLLKEIQYHKNFWPGSHLYDVHVLVYDFIPSSSRIHSHWFTLNQIAVRGVPHK